MTTTVVPLTYNDFVTQVATLAVLNLQTVSGVVSTTEPNFNTLIPQMLNYAELRIQRDVDLLPTVTGNTYTLPIGTNMLSISPTDFVTIQTVSAVVNSVPTPVLPTTKEFIQNVYGSTAQQGPPEVFAMYGGDQATGGNTSNILLFGPYSDSSYVLNVTGTQRMPSLAFNAVDPLASTATTFISANLPDLLIMAAMIFVSGYQRNFGRQSDDPQMAVSYESQYQSLLKGAIIEEYRKKFQASAWSSQSPPIVASPSR